jgi:hypothetical protein
VQRYTQSDAQTSVCFGTSGKIEAGRLPFSCPTGRHLRASAAHQGVSCPSGRAHCPRWPREGRRRPWRP